MAITSSDCGAFRRRGPPSYLAYSAFCSSASFRTASISFFWWPELGRGAGQAREHKEGGAGRGGAGPNWERWKLSPGAGLEGRAG